jgi:hypothetical protein
MPSPFPSGVTHSLAFVQTYKNSLSLSFPISLSLWVSRFFIAVDGLTAWNMGLSGEKVPSAKPTIPDHFFPTLKILTVMYVCMHVCMYVCNSLFIYLFIYLNYGSFYNGVRYTVRWQMVEWLVNDESEKKWMQGVMTWQWSNPDTCPYKSKSEHAVSQPVWIRHFLHTKCYLLNQHAQYVLVVSIRIYLESQASSHLRSIRIPENL